MSRIPFDIPSWWKDAPAARTAAGIVFPPGSRNNLACKVRAILIKGETMKAGKLWTVCKTWGATLALAMVAGLARAGDQDFTLVNATGVEINVLYVSPSDADHWGKDILGKDTLPDGNEADITFDPAEESELWDLKIEDDEGNAIIWHKLDLIEISELTLHWDADKKEATAEKVARAADQDFTLANATGVEINAVYVSPSEADHWGKDILGKDTLPDGEEADIEFSPEEESALWDLKIEDKEGNAIIWTKLNLTEISTLTLHWDADTKKATAEAE